MPNQQIPSATFLKCESGTETGGKTVIARAGSAIGAVDLITTANETPTRPRSFAD